MGSGPIHAVTCHKGGAFMTEQERQLFISKLSFEGKIDDRDGVLGFMVKKDFDLAAAFKGVYDPEKD